MCVCVNGFSGNNTHSLKTNALRTTLTESGVRASEIEIFEVESES